MSDISDQLISAAGTRSDSDARLMAMAADEIDRLQAAAGMAKYWREQYDLVRAHLDRVRAALS